MVCGLRVFGRPTMQRWARAHSLWRRSALAHSLHYVRILCAFCVHFVCVLCAFCVHFAHCTLLTPVCTLPTRHTLSNGHCTLSPLDTNWTQIGHRLDTDWTQWTTPAGKLATLIFICRPSLFDWRAARSSSGARMTAPRWQLSAPTLSLSLRLDQSKSANTQRWLRRPIKDECKKCEPLLSCQRAGGKRSVQHHQWPIKEPQ